MATEPGRQWKDLPMGNHGHNYSLAYSPKNNNTVEATHVPTNNVVGAMSWEPGYYDEYGTVTHLHVEPEHRRKGVATAMWNFAQSLHDRDESIDRPEHDWLNITPEAESWAASMGHQRPE